MNNNDRVYCGSGKKQSNTWLKVSVCLTDLEAHTFEYNGKKYAKLNININDEPNKWGKDVSLSVDTWQPEEQSAPSTPTVEDSGLPF